MTQLKKRAALSGLSGLPTGSAQVARTLESAGNFLIDSAANRQASQGNLAAIRDHGAGRLKANRNDPFRMLTAFGQAYSDRASNLLAQDVTRKTAEARADRKAEDDRVEQSIYDSMTVGLDLFVSDQESRYPVPRQFGKDDLQGLIGEATDYVTGYMSERGVKIDGETMREFLETRKGLDTIMKYARGENRAAYERDEDRKTADMAFKAVNFGPEVLSDESAVYEHINEAKKAVERGMETGQVTTLMIDGLKAFADDRMRNDHRFLAGTEAQDRAVWEDYVRVASALERELDFFSPEDFDDLVSKFQEEYEEVLDDRYDAMAARYARDVGTLSGRGAFMRKVNAQLQEYADRGWVSDDWHDKNKSDENGVGGIGDKVANKVNNKKAERNETLNASKDAREAAQEALENDVNADFHNRGLRGFLFDADRSRYRSYERRDLDSLEGRTLDRALGLMVIDLTVGMDPVGFARSFASLSASAESDAEFGDGIMELFGKGDPRSFAPLRQGLGQDLHDRYGSGWHNEVRSFMTAERRRWKGREGDLYDRVSEISFRGEDAVNPTDVGQAHEYLVKRGDVPPSQGFYNSFNTKMDNMLSVIKKGNANEDLVTGSQLVYQDGLEIIEQHPESFSEDFTGIDSLEQTVRVGLGKHPDNPGPEEKAYITKAARLVKDGVSQGLGYTSFTGMTVPLAGHSLNLFATRLAIDFADLKAGRSSALADLVAGKFDGRLEGVSDDAILKGLAADRQERSLFGEVMPHGVIYQDNKYSWAKVTDAISKLGPTNFVAITSGWNLENSNGMGLTSDFLGQDYAEGVWTREELREIWQNLHMQEVSGENVQSDVRTPGNMHVMEDYETGFFEGLGRRWITHPGSVRGPGDLDELAPNRVTIPFYNTEASLELQGVKYTLEMISNNAGQGPLYAVKKVSWDKDGVMTGDYVKKDGHYLLVHNHPSSYRTRAGMEWATPEEADGAGQEKEEA